MISNSKVFKHSGRVTLYRIRIFTFCMKHNWKVTFLLILMFFLSQLIGLYIVGFSVGEELAFGIEKPQFEKETSYASVFILIIIVTLIALLLARFKAVRLWKVWFFISIVFVLTIALSVFVHHYIAFILALLAAVFKVIKPNVVIHNLSELFIYGGLAAIFVESFNVLSISILIVLIALYDMYAVWKSKHMVALANFQSKAKIFAGFLIPYAENRRPRLALLGGGDAGFPLLFTGVVFVEHGVIALIIPFIVTLALFLLLYFGNKNKFYPAMPFLGLGCFVGYGLVWLISSV